MKNKFGLWLNIVTICLCVCAIAIGVYSATSASLSISGQIGFEVHNCTFKLDGTILSATTQEGTVRETTTISRAEYSDDAELDLDSHFAEGKGMYFSDLAPDGDKIVFTFNIENMSAYKITVLPGAVILADQDITYEWSQNSMDLASLIGETPDGTGADYGTLTLTITLTNIDEVETFDAKDLQVYITFTKYIQSIQTSAEIVSLRNVSAYSHFVDCSINGASSPTDVTVYRYGKNLFDLSQWTCSHTVTAEILSNNSIKFNNPTEYAAGTRTIEWFFTLPKGTYTLSGYTEDIENSKLNIYRMEDSGSWSMAYQCIANKGESVSISLNKQRQVKITVFAPQGVITFNNLQLEVGDTATEIEEYITPATYTPQADGKVNGITSLSPNMTLFTNTDGVIIECKYKTTLTKLNVQGKKMAVIGDSISRGVSSVILSNGSVTPATSESNDLTNINKAWWQQVQSRYGIGDVVNNSVTGACFSIDGSTNNYRFTYYLNETYLPSDLDIILVFGGTNDYSRDRNLGSFSDEPSTANNATFCASVKATLKYLTTNFPSAAIIYFTPLPRWAQTGTILTDENGNRYIEGGEEYNELNAVNLLLEDYANAIKSLCAMYHVPVCDLLANSGMDMSNFEFKMQYAPDGLHPNADGTDMYVNNAIFPFFDKIWEVA